MYKCGKGVEKNYGEAAKWYRLAAEQDNRSACYNIGWMHCLGNGAPKDLAEGMKWYRRAAQLGHFRSQMRLGLLLSKKSGGDTEEGLMWLYLARENPADDKEAKETRDIEQQIVVTEKTLDEARILQAKQKAGDFKVISSEE